MYSCCELLKDSSVQESNGEKPFAVSRCHSSMEATTVANNATASCERDMACLDYNSSR